MTPDAEPDPRKQRQVIYWRLLAAANGMTDAAKNIEAMTAATAREVGLPEMVLDPLPAVDTLVQRYPELKRDFEALQKVCNPPGPDGEAPAPQAEVAEGAGGLRRALCYSKLLLNVFGPNTLTGSVTAQQYAQWCQDVARFEECFGYAPGALRGKRGPGGGQGGAPAGTGAGHLISEEQLQAGLKGMEGDLIKRMALREVLKDDQMAARLTPSMPLVEQLLRDKSNLSGNALKNAKALIQS